MTPVEVGLLGGAVVFFGAGLVRVGPAWTAAVGVSLWGGYLGWGGNLFLVDWFPTGGHTSAVVTTPVGTYLGGALDGGHPRGDLKVAILLLWGFAGTLFVTPRGESLLVGLIGLVSGLVTMGTDHLVILYLGLELQALCLYTLAGLARFQEERTDSALRYLLAGSFVSGFLLWGFFEGYTTGGGLHWGEHNLTAGAPWILGTLFFKVGVFPFHLWPPSVYAPLDWGTLGLLTGALKVNLWFLLGSTLEEVLTFPVVLLVGFLSVGVGAVGGFFQTSLGGVLGYSGVINGGYLLLAGGTAGGSFGWGVYLVGYLAGSLGFILCLHRWGNTTPGSWVPGVTLAAGALGYYMALNLSGLPVYPGFFFKLLLLKEIFPLGWSSLFLVVAASLAPAVYYVGTLEGVLLREGSPRELEWTPVMSVIVLILLNGVTSFLNDVA